jgi:homogentisate 1,2-dioxygenase
LPDGDTDFLAGLVTMATPRVRRPMASASTSTPPTASMAPGVLDADGELLIVPQHGRLRAGHLNCGRLARRPPASIAIIPRGMTFRVELPDGAARAATSARTTAPACACPELGPIGANGLANPRDFAVPVAWYRGP